MTTIMILPRQYRYDPRNIKNNTSNNNTGLTVRIPKRPTSRSIIAVVVVVLIMSTKVIICCRCVLVVLTLPMATSAYALLSSDIIPTHALPPTTTTTTTACTRFRHGTNHPHDSIGRGSTSRSRKIVMMLSQQEKNNNIDVIQNDTESSTTSHENNNSVGWIHGVTSKSGPLNEAVLTILHQHNDPNINTNNNTNNYQHYTRQDANELIEIGAVWAKMETLSNEEILSMYDDDNAEENDARYLYADLPKGWGSGDDSDNSSDEVAPDDDLEAYLKTMTRQRYRRILTPTFITAGIDVRVYPQPRRFTAACDTLRHRTNLLYEDTTFIVVDKPPMLPTQPDASNYLECCPSCVNLLLGPFYDILGHLVKRPLLCHRIDTCVGGVVVLSKDRNGQKVFHQYQRERQLRKMYLAVTTQPVPTGQHIHWMWAQQSSRRRGPKNTNGPPCQLVRHTPPDSRRIARTYWNRCVLEVVQCIPIQIDPEKLLSSSKSSNEQQQEQPPPQYYQSTIRLVTGRKHQVRAQLASLGCPILHDTLYGPIAGYTFDDLVDAEEDMERQISQCRVPTQPIGLQAAGILFGGIKVRANTPWWG